MSEKAKSPEWNTSGPDSAPTETSTGSRPSTAVEKFRRALSLFWDISESDFPTFVIPNSAFGLLGALSGRLTTGPPPTTLQVLARLPAVVAFNWYTVFVFELANQRCPESIAEDAINKPWRPIPSGKLTAHQVRRLMLAAVPLALAANYLLGVWRQGVFITVLTWLYNDLRGGDEPVRDAIIAAAYALFNGASLQLAANGMFTRDGYVWTGVVSGVILTTMQVQDLKDQEGDRGRGRKSIPLWLGERVSRVSIAVLVPFWSCVCAYFWGLRPWMYCIPLLMGLLVSGNVLLEKTPKEDASTWRMWCVWTMILYLLPIIGGL